jgi:protein-serine/threonine kinase
MQSDRGYTKAADLWSLGCLTAVVLTGEPLFDNAPKSCKMNSHRTRAIEKLKWKMNRRQVGQRAQDFVFQLLQHDASKRMDVKQALQHEWFTNPAHKSEFDALYERSIRDWKPRSTTEPRIVGLESYVKACPSQSNQNPSASDLESNGLSQYSYIKSESCSQWVGFSLLSTAETDDRQGSGLTHTPESPDVDLLPCKDITSTDSHLHVSSNNADAYSVTSSQVSVTHYATLPTLTAPSSPGS